MNDRVPLKDCPFCGGRPMEFIEDSYHVIICNFGRKGGHHAGCGARIQRKLVPPASWENKVVENREAWNNRFDQNVDHDTKNTLEATMEKEFILRNKLNPGR